jgi:hypothetical protein
VTPHDAKALVPVASPAVPALLAPDLDKAADLARQEKAKATRRAYRSDFAVFEAWCASRSVNRDQRLRVMRCHAELPRFSNENKCYQY